MPGGRISARDDGEGVGSGTGGAFGSLMRMTPVILCGGSGTRLWPRSRPERPKPFLNLVGDSTLFEATLARCGDPERFDPPIIVAGAHHAALIEEQLPAGSQARIVVEPAARNTAPAIALAAAQLPADAVMLVCPSDHHIADVDAFRAAAGEAAKLAQDGWLVTFGIAAKAPETGFGYIRRGAAIEGTGGYRVERFVEKPDRARAEQFLAEGGYFWNGGLFAFTAGTFLTELAQHRPGMAAAVAEASAGARTDGARILPAATPFEAIDGDSIDYAVMENTGRAAVVPADMGWSDIGNWPALREALACDAHGNCSRGPAELVDCRNVLTDSDGPRISVIGLDDVIVVVDGDEVMVTRAGNAQQVGKLKGAGGG